MHSRSTSPEGAQASGALCARIRADIMVLHREIEALPVSESLVAGTIDPGVYVHLLKQLAAFHRHLDAFVATNVAALGPDAALLIRGPQLASDLERLAGDTVAYEDLLPETQEFLEWLEAAANEHPLALLGALYVSEGSRMGSMILSRRLAQGFGVELERGVGLDYHLAGMSEAPMRWQRVRGLVEELSMRHGIEDVVRKTALRTMEGFVSVYRAVGMANLVMPRVTA